MSTTAADLSSLDNTTDDPSRRAPLVVGGHDFHFVTEAVCGIVEKERTPLAWWVALAVSMTLAGMLLAMITYLITTGIGVWGLQNPVSWGWAIVNFVFWVGIGHAGTLISAILFLLRAPWRTAIFRAAEASTIFAVATAGLFPFIHLRRLWVAYYIMPYPNGRELWPNFRSPLVWDVLAISTYFTVSLVFFTVGLIPDNELSKKLGVALSPETGGPVVDGTLMSSVEGVFACGNVLHVHDLVDWVSEEADACGAAVVEYLRQTAYHPVGGVQFAEQFATGQFKEIIIEYNGDFHGLDLKPVTTAFLKGILDSLVQDGVNAVNAPILAKDMGIKVSEVTTADSEKFLNRIAATVITTEMSCRVAGSVFGKTDARIVRIDDFIIEIVPEGHLSLIHNLDEPGAIGSIAKAVSFVISARPRTVPRATRSRCDTCPRTTRTESSSAHAARAFRRASLLNIPPKKVYVGTNATTAVAAAATWRSRGAIARPSAQVAHRLISPASSDASRMTCAACRSGRPR